MKKQARNKGFTLLEIIAGVVLLALLALMLVPLLGKPVTSAPQPATSLDEAFDLMNVMENIKATYSNDLQALSSAVTSEGTVISNQFGAYTVVHNRFVTFTAGTEQPGGTNILKVTVKGDTGEVLTRLFTY
jgi:prepilin-type N-terminal cleavage/methylation domain-containing protein